MQATPYPTQQCKAKQQSRLDLETSRPSPAPGSLKLPTLACDVWLLVLVRAEAKVLDSFTRVLRAAEEYRVRAGWRTHGELVEGEALAARLEDSGAGCAGETQSGDGQLGDFEEATGISM